MSTYRLDDCDIVTETSAAILIEYEDEKHWIPLSQVNEIHRSPRKGESSIVMQEWVAREKGFI